MKELDNDDLDTAITLGDAVCRELGICCDTRGRVIFQIYKKLEEFKQRQENLGNQTQTKPPIDRDT